MADVQVAPPQPPAAAKLAPASPEVKTEPQLVDEIQRLLESAGQLLCLGVPEAPEADAEPAAQPEQQPELEEAAEPAPAAPEEEEEKQEEPSGMDNLLAAAEEEEAAGATLVAMLAAAASGHKHRRKPHRPAIAGAGSSDSAATRMRDSSGSPVAGACLKAAPEQQQQEEGDPASPWLQSEMVDAGPRQDGRPRRQVQRRRWDTSPTPTTSSDDMMGDLSGPEGEVQGPGEQRQKVRRPKGEGKPRKRPAKRPTGGDGGDGEGGEGGEGEGGEGGEGGAGGAKPKRPPKRPRKYASNELTIDIFEAEGVFNMRLDEAAWHLGFGSPTSIKKAMARLNISKWPNRTRETAKNLLLGLEEYLPRYCTVETVASVMEAARRRLAPYLACTSGIELSEELRKVRQKLYKLKDQEKDPAYPEENMRRCVERLVDDVINDE